MQEYIALKTRYDTNYNISKTHSAGKNIDNLSSSDDNIYFKRREFTMKDVKWEILSPRDRELLRAHIIDGISYYKLAKMFGCSTNALKNIIDKSLKKLKYYFYIQETIENNGDLLTPIQKKYMTEHFINGNTIKEIAQKEQKTKRSVERVLKRGRQKVEKYIEI